MIEDWTGSNFQTLKRIWSGSAKSLTALLEVARKMTREGSLSR
jgi:hypothetical protein